MKKICILGWYGTETLGDRAILDGILKIFCKKFSSFKIYLGSLYPFLSERTLYEDNDIFHNFNNFNDFDIVIFDSKDKKELKKYIADSDLVIMGGGPLMDLYELYLIRFSFKFAKKNNISTCLLGCGFGPLNNPKFINVVKDILRLSDLSIFRDEISMNNAKKLFSKDNYFHLVDPAIISVLNYKKYLMNNKENIKSNNDILVNLREWPAVCGNKNSFDNKSIILLINKLSLEFDNVFLVPNHCFFIGGDDRSFMNSILLDNHFSNVKILNNPLSLTELYDKIYSSFGCVGMRYHSIVMHTILSGNNYIIDYTNSKNGKIVGFLNEIGNPEFYKERYYSCTSDDVIDVNKCISYLKSGNKYDFVINSNYIDEYINVIERCLDV